MNFKHMSDFDGNESDPANPDKPQGQPRFQAEDAGNSEWVGFGLNNYGERGMAELHDRTHGNAIDWVRNHITIDVDIPDQVRMGSSCISQSLVGGLVDTLKIFGIKVPEMLENGLLTTMRVAIQLGYLAGKADKNGDLWK